jgi:hypothetical protein
MKRLFHRPFRLKRSPLRRGGAFALAFFLLSPFAWAKFEHEQLMLESQIQERIERILSKTLPASGYLITVKVTMDERAVPASVQTRTARQNAKNPFLDESRFMLPGVPQKKEFVQAPGAENNETTVNAATAEALIKRIAINILVAPEVTREQIRAMQEVISVSVPFNPLRGDELDIQTSPLLGKPAARAPAAGAGDSGAVNSPATSVAPAPADRTMIFLYTVLGAMALVLGVLVFFLFGPVRGFLNRLVAVLPRVGEQAAFAVTNANNRAAGAAGVNGGGVAMNGYGAAHNGNGHSGNGSGPELPFHFIREEQLVKLPFLLRQMPPKESAIVLAYLPAAWASRILGDLDARLQTTLMQELSQAKEVPPEVVKEVEAQIKAKLPYWVGGTEWVNTVYQLTEPQVQRTILGSLHDQAPDLAQSLRRKTFFFEDMTAIGAGALRLLLQEVGYSVAAQALKDEKAELRDAVLKRLPPGMREIIQQELDLSADDQAAAADAKLKVVALARQMMADGRIAMGEKK